MQITKAEYVKSCVRSEHYPTDGLPEMIFAGRSNVGKSSFINGITNNSKLAKTSNKPGKTRLINMFVFDEKYIIASTLQVYK